MRSDIAGMWGNLRLLACGDAFGISSTEALATASATGGGDMSRLLATPTSSATPATAPQTHLIGARL